MRVIKDLFGKRCLSKISAIMVVTMLMAYYCPQMAFENVLAATVATSPIVYDVHVTNQVYGSSPYVPLKVRTNATDATALSYNNVYAYYTYLTASDSGYATYNANAEGTTVSTASTYKWQYSANNSTWTDIKTGLITAAGCMGNTAGTGSAVGSARFVLNDTYADKYIRCIITPKDSVGNVGASVTTPAVYVKQDAAVLLNTSILPSADANTDNYSTLVANYHYGAATTYNTINSRVGRYPFLKFDISSFSLPTNSKAANEAVKSAVVRFYPKDNGDTGTAISAYDISSKYSSWTESPVNGGTPLLDTDLTFNRAVAAGILNANNTINTATLPTADTTTSYTIPYKGAANNYFFDINVKPIVANNTSRSDNTISFMLSGAGGLTFQSKERGYSSTITNQLPILILNKITGISVSGTPTKTVYNKYDTIDISGITVTASYADGSTNTVTIPNDSGHILGFDASKVGSGTASVSYGGCTATLFNYTVQDNIIRETKTEQQLYDLVYNAPRGESFNLSKNLPLVTDMNNVFLKPGESVSMDFLVNGYVPVSIGFTVNGKKFDIQKPPSSPSFQPAERLYYLEDPSGAQWDLYNNIMSTEAANFILVRGNDTNRNTIYWYIEGGGLLGSGKYTFDSLSDNLKIDYYPKTSTVANVSGLRYGVLDKLPAQKRSSPNVINYICKQSTIPQNDNPEKYLVIDSEKGTLTEAEINGMLYYLENVSFCPNNVENTLLYGSSSKPPRVAWLMYKLVKRKEFLDHLIRFADLSILGRNDSNTGYVTVVGTKTPIWPNFFGWKIQNNERRVKVEISEAIMEVVTLAARAIAQNSQLWDEIIPDGTNRTYYQAAKQYLDIGNESIDSFVIPYFLDPNTNLLIYRSDIPGLSKEDYASAPDRVYIPWNRQWFAVNGMVDLVESMDKLNLYSEKKQQYEGIIRDSFKFFFEVSQDVTIDDKTALLWAYGHSNDAMGAEDLGHASADIYSISKAYETGRYSDVITNDSMQKIANTMYYVMYAQNGVFTDLVNGTSSSDSWQTNSMLDFGFSFEQLIKFCPQLYDTIMPFLICRGYYSPCSMAALFNVRGYVSNVQTQSIAPPMITNFPAGDYSNMSSINDNVLIGLKYNNKFVLPSGANYNASDPVGWPNGSYFCASSQELSSKFPNNIYTNEAQNITYKFGDLSGNSRQALLLNNSSNIIPVPKGKYTKVSFVGSGFWQNSNSTITLNYSDGSYSILPFKYSNWTETDAQNVILKVKRYDTSNPAVDGESYLYNGGNVTFNEYVFDIPTDKRDCELVNINFPKTSYEMLFAVSAKGMTGDYARVQGETLVSNLPDLSSAGFSNLQNVKRARFYVDYAINNNTSIDTTKLDKLTQIEKKLAYSQEQVDLSNYFNDTISVQQNSIYSYPIGYTYAFYRAYDGVLLNNVFPYGKGNYNGIDFNFGTFNGTSKQAIRLNGYSVIPIKEAAYSYVNFVSSLMSNNKLNAYMVSLNFTDGTSQDYSIDINNSMFGTNDGSEIFSSLNNLMGSSANTRPYLYDKKEAYRTALSVYKLDVPKGKVVNGIKFSSSPDLRILAITAMGENMNGIEAKNSAESMINSLNTMQSTPDDLLNGMYTARYLTDFSKSKGQTVSNEGILNDLEIIKSSLISPTINVDLTPAFNTDIFRGLNDDQNASACFYKNYALSSDGIQSKYTNPQDGLVYNIGNVNGNTNNAINVTAGAVTVSVPQALYKTIGFISTISVDGGKDGAYNVTLHYDDNTTENIPVMLETSSSKNAQSHLAFTSHLLDTNGKYLTGSAIIPFYDNVYFNNKVYFNTIKPTSLKKINAITFNQKVGVIVLAVSGCNVVNPTNEVRVVNANDDSSADLSVGGEFNAKIIAINSNSSSKNYTVICTVYDGVKFIGVALSDTVTVDLGQTKTIRTKNFKVPKSTGYTVENFLWEDLTNLKPLSTKRTIVYK